MKNIRAKDFCDECPNNNFAGRHLCATRRYILAKFQNRMDIQKGKKKSILDQCWCRYSIEYLKYTANDGWSTKLARLIVTRVEGSRGVCRFHFTRNQNAEWHTRLVFSVLTAHVLASRLSNERFRVSSDDKLPVYVIVGSNKRRISLGDFWSVDLREPLGWLVVFTWNRSISTLHVITRISFAHCYFVVVNNKF